MLPQILFGDLLLPKTPKYNPLRDCPWLKSVWALLRLRDSAGPFWDTTQKTLAIREMRKKLNWPSPQANRLEPTWLRNIRLVRLVRPVRPFAQFGKRSSLTHVYFHVFFFDEITFQVALLRYLWKRFHMVSHGFTWFHMISHDFSYTSPSWHV